MPANKSNNAKSMQVSFCYNHNNNKMLKQQLMMKSGTREMLVKSSHLLNNMLNNVCKFRYFIKSLAMKNKIVHNIISYCVQLHQGWLFDWIL